MSDLVEFLLSRIAEDEAEARDEERAELVLRYANVDWAARVLTECEAKRRIVEDYQALEADYRVTRSEVTEARRFQALVSVGQLAAVYDDHPDYDEAWRP